MIKMVNMGNNYIHNMIMGKIPCFNAFLSHNVGTIELFFEGLSHSGSQSFKLTGFNLIPHGLCISGQKRGNYSR